MGHPEPRNLPGTRSPNLEPAQLDHLGVAEDPVGPGLAAGEEETEVAATLNKYWVVGNVTGREILTLYISGLLSTRSYLTRLTTLALDI